MVKGGTGDNRVTAGVSGLAVYILLNEVLGSCITIPRLEGGAVSGIDKLLLIVLLAAGILAGYLYHPFSQDHRGILFQTGSQKSAHIERGAGRSDPGPGRKRAAYDHVFRRQ